MSTKLAPIESLTKEQLYAMVLSLLETTKQTEDALDGIRRAFYQVERDADQDPAEKAANRRLLRTIAEYTRTEGGFARVLCSVRRVRERVEAEFQRFAAKEWQALVEFIETVDTKAWDNPEKHEEYIFNEGRLYDALGKDDARSVLCVWGAYQRIRKARERLALTKEPEAATKTEETIYKFSDTDLFYQMIHLLMWSRDLADKSELTEKWKQDKHAPKQFENLKKRTDELLEQFKHAIEKRESFEES